MEIEQKWKDFYELRQPELRWKEEQWKIDRRKELEWEKDKEER